MNELEKKSKSDNSSAESVKIDNAKIDRLDLGINFDLSKEIEELEATSAHYKKERTFWEKIKACEFEVEFENKMNMVRMLGGFAAFAGVLSGIDQSVISGAMIGITRHFDTTSHEVSLISSLMPLGAMTGSLMMTPLNEYWGRKKALIISCIWYTAGALICALTHSYQLMYAGRFLLGIGVGIEGGCVGVYIAESVPAEVRGNLVSLYQLSIALGEVLGYAIAAIFYDMHSGWRYMLGSSLVFSSILFVGLFFLPESPRWLAHKNRIGESYLVWKRLRDINDPAAQLEFMEMRQASYEEAERRSNESRLQAWSDLFTIPRNRRALIYAVIMVTLGQLTGVNAVMYYMSSLMAKIGFSQKRSVFMSLVGGGSLLVGTIPAILWMDRFGRRTWGMNIIGFFVGLVLVGVGYKINVDTHKAAAEGVYLSGIILYMGFFGAYACLTWVCPSESFTLQTRTAGMSICSFFLYLWAFTVTYNFNKMKNAFTYTGLTLGFYGGIAFIGFFYQLLFMPETKDKTLEEIDDLFSMHTSELVKTNVHNIKNFWGKK